MQSLTVWHTNFEHSYAQIALLLHQSIQKRHRQQQKSANKSIADSFLHQWSMLSWSAANNIASASECNEPWVKQTSDHSPCSATEVCVLPCQQMSGAKARYFYSDNYKDEDDDEQLQNMINGIVSIHIHWRVSLVFQVGWTTPGLMHSCYFVPFGPFIQTQLWTSLKLTT